jgi:hypothetical protein
MDPLACTVRTGADGVVTATFLNGDERAASVWVTANCTLVKPSGDAACVGGYFWTQDGQPFAAQNWSASIAADFSTVSTSEGSVWQRQSGPAYAYLGGGFIGAGDDLVSGNMTLADAELLWRCSPNKVVRDAARHRFYNINAGALI